MVLSYCSNYFVFSLLLCLGRVCSHESDRAFNVFEGSELTVYGINSPLQVTQCIFLRVEFCKPDHPRSQTTDQPYKAQETHVILVPYLGVASDWLKHIQTQIIVLMTNSVTFLL